MDNIDEIKKLYDLQQQGAITQEEFEKQKAALLNQTGNSQPANQQQAQPYPAQNQQYAGQGQPYPGPNQQYSGQQGQPYPPQGVDAPSVGLNILSFFIPIVGLILFCIWNNTFPKKAKSAGIAALIGFIVSIILSIISYVFVFAAASSIYY